ncbi:hypothetical protein HBI15_153230 [Parastagonospora nodorum]|nr:hypothetical protein HBI15_153230 [Parastagonospora nodorum]
MDTLTVTPIKDDDNLLNTINSHIKLRKLKEVREADALKQRLELEAQLRKVSEEEELAKTKKEKREKEAQEREAGLDSLLDSDDYCLDSSLDIDPKDDLEDEEVTTAKDLAREQKERLKALLNAKMRDSLSARVETAIEHCTLEEGDTFTLRTRRKCEMPKQKANAWKNEVVAIDPANSILCDLSDPLVVRFCIFSDSALENIGIPTNKEVVEMQTNTATALANELAAVNKLVRLQTFILKILEHVETVYWIIAEANMPAVHSKATKHYLALLAAQFALVCGFGKVDRHMFRADNTISGRTVFDEFYNCKLEGTIIAKFYKDLRKYN